MSSSLNMQHLEEVYRKWEKKMPASIPPPPPPSGRTRERINDDLLPHRRRRRGRTAALPTLDLVPELAHFKMTPPPMTVDPSQVSRPSIGRCCPQCSRQSRELFFNEEIPRMGLRNVLHKLPMPARPGFLSRYLPHVNYELFQAVNHPYPVGNDVKQKVLGNQRVQLAIHRSAISESEGRPEDEYQKAAEKHEKRAVRILRNMAASISNYLIRLTGWFLLKILGFFLSGVQVHEGQMEMIKRAAQGGVPLVIVPLHRSHLDYVLLSFIFHMYGIRLPFVAAGDNLNIPVFGWLLRRLGAFFIKRKLDKEIGKKDWLYRSTLHTYMEEILRHNQNMEFFIEGGRSRSGKALPPKGGLLSCVVDAYRDDIISDAYIIPASMSYEKILDGNFVNEQMGLPKKKESFLGAIGGILQVLSSSYGNVRIDFAQPFSLKEYLSSPPLPIPLNSDLPTVSPRRPKLQKAVSDHSLYGTDVVIEDQRQLIRGLGEHILHDSVKVNTVMSTNLVAFLLLTKFRQGVEMSQLEQAVDFLKRDIMVRGRDVGFTGKSVDVIKHSLALFGPKLVVHRRARVHPDIVPAQGDKGGNGEERREIVMPNTGLPHVFELSYYGSGLISIFLMESVVATSVIALCNEDGHVIDSARKDPIILSRDRLLRKSEELCDMLQFEFTFVPPCGHISVAIGEAVDQLLISEVLMTHLEPESKDWSKRIGVSASWDSEEDSDEDNVHFKDQKIEVNTSQESQCRLGFLQSIIAPLIEGYWLSACNLIRLLDVDVPETQFSQVVNSYAKDRISKGLAMYAESCAMDTLRNSWRLFVHWKVMDWYLDSENTKMVHLNEPFRSKEKLGVFIDRIEAFRS